MLTSSCRDPTIHRAGGLSINIAISNLENPSLGMDDVERERPRKYNNPDDLDELCRRFLKSKDNDMGSAIEYCKGFLSLLNEKPPTSGAVVFSRVKSR